MTKKRIVLVLVLSFATPALADDYIPAPWANDGADNRIPGLPGSTYSEWTYDDPIGVYSWDPPESSWIVPHPDKLDPEPIDPCNPSYFSAQRWGIHYDPCLPGGDPCNPPWQDVLPYGFKVRQGGINYAYASWDLNNFIHNQQFKDIRVQVTYFTGAGPAGVDYAGAGTDHDNDPCTPPLWFDAGLVSTTDLGSGWWHEVLAVTMEPNPDYEWFEMAFDQTVIIDQIVIETLCYDPVTQWQ